MDHVWLAAPLPAMQLRRSAGAAAWTLNRAAIEWSIDVREGEASWQVLADEVLASLPDTWEARSHLGALALRWRALTLADSWLVWITPDPVVPTAGGEAWGGAADKLELIQDFGRMGLFERDIRSGTGRWDKHMFRLLAFDPVIGTPDFTGATERVHPDDRAKFRADHLRYIGAPGRHESRYRLLLPKGLTRDIHSLVEVRSGPDGKPAAMIGVLIDDSESSARVRAQQAVSAQLAEALNLARVSVFRVDRSTEVVHFNEAGYELLGVPPRAEGLTLAELGAAIHPDDRRSTTAADEGAVARAGVVDVEARFRHPEGGYRHLLTRRVAERDEAGRVLALSGVLLDQTEQIEDRTRAQALSRRIEHVADAAGVGIWTLDGPFGHFEWNAQARRLHGLAERAPLPGLRAWLANHVHAQDRRRVIAERRRAARHGGSGFEIEFRIQRGDGEIRWLVCRAREEALGDRSTLAGILFDVTDRRATEAELQRQQDRLALATRAAGLGVWERDLDGRITFWDENMYRLRGFDPADPRAPDELARLSMGPEQLAQTHELTRAHLEAGQPYLRELRLVWPDGTVRWVASVGTAQRDAQGRALRMTGINWDITHRKQADAALRDKEAAERASRAKSEFLARMSHELRTPLNAVLGFAQLMEMEAGPTFPAAQLERVTRIRSAGAHLLALIDDVLDVASIEAGNLPVALEPVSVAQALDDCREWIATLMQRMSVTLHVAPIDAWVNADPRRLRQILANLLSNAVKYNRAGGQVWVNCEPAPAAEPPAWDIVVGDNGHGLDERQREQLFEPFNRLGAERSGIEGVGIGLVIVRHLVEFMGGSVGVESAPGIGTEFRIRLPAALPRDNAAGEAAGASPVPLPAAAAPAEAAWLDVLYIEDNPVNVLLLEGLVELRSYVRLHVAGDGISGVAKALAVRPDVVLVDMQLPDIDGNEVLRRLRAEPLLAGATVIALSANAMPDDVERAKSLGFEDYWTKPINFQRVLAGFDELVSRRAAAVRA